MTCTDEALTKTAYSTSTCDAGTDTSTDDYDSALADYQYDDATTGDDDFNNQYIYWQRLCSGGTSSATDDAADDETDDKSDDKSEDDDSSSVCFAGSEMVTLESGVSKSIADIVVGDRVLAANAQGALSFSDVIAVPHAKNNHRVMFNEISLANGADIRITGEHLLPVAASCGTDAVFTVTAAKNVATDSCVMTVDGQSAVVSNNKVAGNGIYTIVTNEE